MNLSIAAASTFVFFPIPSKFLSHRNNFLLLIMIHLFLQNYRLLL